jgi:hypothetical protein
MNARKISKEVKRVVFALVFAGAILCATNGCNAIGYLSQLSYLGQWASSLLGTSSTTST